MAIVAAVTFLSEQSAEKDSSDWETEPSPLPTKDESGQNDKDVTMAAQACEDVVQPGCVPWTFT